MPLLLKITVEIWIYAMLRGDEDVELRYRGNGKHLLSWVKQIDIPVRSMEGYTPHAAIALRGLLTRRTERTEAPYQPAGNKQSEEAW